MNTLNHLRRRLAAVENLSQLAKDAGINLRTLRRIKNGYTHDVMLGTLERLEKALEKVQK